MDEADDGAVGAWWKRKTIVVAATHLGAAVVGLTVGLAVRGPAKSTESPWPLLDVVEEQEARAESDPVSEPWRATGPPVANVLGTNDSVILTANRVEDGIHLRWAGKIGEDITDIRVLRGEGQDGPWKLIHTAEALSVALLLSQPLEKIQEDPRKEPQKRSFMDSDVESDKMYRYVLKFTDLNGEETRACRMQYVWPDMYIRRINCGGKEVAAPDGVPWESDTLQSSGVSRWSSPKKLADVEEDMQPVYQSERWSYTSVPYRLDVRPGKYLVTLYFAEINPAFMTKGKRVFDIYVAGTRAHRGVDVFDAAGGGHIPHQLRVEVEVKSGALGVIVQGRVGGATIKGLEIRETR